MSRSYLICAIFVLLLATRGSFVTWSKVFSPGNLWNTTSSSIRAFASEKLSALRSIRDKLFEDPSKISKREESLANILKNRDTFFSFMAPLKKMIYSKKGIDTLASMMASKRDLFRKLLEIQGTLEPTVRRYMTDKYNGFLTSLIPYSENIGVPPFVLNSMKIPQDLDPRWHLIQTILKSQGGMESFLRTLLKGEAFAKMPDVIESRSGDETELISDQEPDAMGQAYRRNPQFFMSSFKRRLMKPGPGNRFKLAPTPMKPYQQIGYENGADQTGQYGNMMYEVRTPDDGYAEAESNSIMGAGHALTEADMMDMAMSASGHGGRGHGYGHGHGHGHASYGGFLDPFTILGGLAFLTYLGLMLQNSLNRNGTMGRSLPWETRVPMVPINLKPPVIEPKEKGRQGKSLVVKQKMPPVTLDIVLGDMSHLWKELEELKTYAALHSNTKCTRYKLCKVTLNLRETNLDSLFSSKLMDAAADEGEFVEKLFHGKKLVNMCAPYDIKHCALT